MNDEIKDMVREIAAEHGVALDRGDPILVLQTATRRILEAALREAQQSLGEAMARHRSELELAATKWQADSKRTASQLVQEVHAAITTSVRRELDQAARTAAAQLAPALARHEKALSRSTLAVAVAAAIALLAAAASVWANHGQPQQLDRGKQVAWRVMTAQSQSHRTGPKEHMPCR